MNRAADPMETNDAALVAGVIAGEAAAWETFKCRVRDPLYRLARRYYDDPLAAGEARNLLFDFQADDCAALRRFGNGKLESFIALAGDAMLGARFSALFGDDPKAAWRAFERRFAAEIRTRLLRTFRLMPGQTLPTGRDLEDLYNDFTLHLLAKRYKPLRAYSGSGEASFAWFLLNRVLANWCRDNGMLLHIHRAMHAVVDRNPLHGIHFRVLTKCLRLSGGDHMHSGTVVGKLEGDREATLGWVDLMRESFVPENRTRGIFFDQDFGTMPGMIPVASGGIHVWHMPALVAIFGDDVCLQFGGGTLGHPWGNAAGAAANRIAVEACVLARNEGVDLEKSGREVLTNAAKHSPELAIAMETWKEIKFEYDTVDKLDVAS